MSCMLHIVQYHALWANTRRNVNENLIPNNYIYSYKSAGVNSIIA